MLGVFGGVGSLVRLMSHRPAPPIKILHVLDGRGPTDVDAVDDNCSVVTIETSWIRCVCVPQL